MSCEKIMRTLSFPEEAISSVLAAEKDNAGLFSLCDRYFRGNISFDSALKLIAIVKDKKTPQNLAHLLFLLRGEENLEKIYDELSLPKEVFLDSADDLRVKLFECKKVTGEWGNFVPFWYEGFFTLRRFALGRLQYDYHPYEWDSYRDCGVTIKRGDTVYSCHIPSDARPFDRAAVLDSLKRAYAFFEGNLRGGILPVVCHSWLLHPSLSECLPESSNILSFAKLFHIIKTENDKGFPDAWRIFSKDYTDRNDTYPQDTSLQRSILAYLNEGHGIGAGCGILLFDGEKIL